PASPVEVAPNENFESFTTGNLPIGGWTSDYNPDFTITSVNTIEGTRSWRHTSDGSGFADTGSSPTFAAYFGYLGADIRINPAGTGSLYQFVPIGDVIATNPNTYFNTRINFTQAGTIEALQVVANVGVFVPTTGTWAPNEVFEIGVSTDAAGVLKVYKNGATIFTGTEISFAVTGTAGRIRQSGQYGANTVGGTNSMMTLDNLTSSIPEPTTLAVIAGAALVGLKRRR
ncbi:MAG TPA: hypothetical protein PK402_14630, partial [Tepidisphaeraceae bacterium]|nr:hypothetical protein [Tepidisphaeraceae bacterium]